MSNDILKNFSKLKIVITPKFAKSLERLVLQFELRKDHPLVINSAELGVHKISFTTNDRAILFDLAGIYESDIASLVRGIPSIDNNFKVISDSLNLLCIYLVHLIVNSKLKAKVKHKAAKDVLMYLQYRFFSSLVNRRFPHGAHSDIMQQVVEDLSLKYDVKVHGSWKKLFDHKAETLLGSSSLHKKAIDKFQPDDKVLYALSDTQTRLRSQLNKLTTLYYDYKKANDYMKSASSTTVVDGKRIIKESDSGFESVAHHIYMKLQSKTSFINPKYVDMIVAIQTTINKGILNRMLISISDTAITQIEDGTDSKLIKRRDGSETYKGIWLLVNNIIHTVYMNAIHDKSVNINNRLEIFNSARNLYSTHRSNNDVLQNTKDSVKLFITDQRITKRENTISTLTISLVLYLTLMSFDVL